MKLAAASAILFVIILSLSTLSYSAPGAEYAILMDRLGDVTVLPKPRQNGLPLYKLLKDGQFLVLRNGDLKPTRVLKITRPPFSIKALVKSLYSPYEFTSLEGADKPFDFRLEKSRSRTVNEGVMSFKYNDLDYQWRKDQPGMWYFIRGIGLENALMTLEPYTGTLVCRGEVQRSDHEYAIGAATAIKVLERDGALKQEGTSRREKMQWPLRDKVKWSWVL